MAMWQKLQTTARWLPAYLWQRSVRRASRARPLHLIIALVDHFEPTIVPENPRTFAARDVQLRRLENWIRTYPSLVDSLQDSGGFAFRHTYFYPAEQYDPEIVAMLAKHCRDGWGETEIHLHHGVKAPDTSQRTRAILESFRDALVSHGCLSRLAGSSLPRYAFVHGNWS